MGGQVISLRPTMAAFMRTAEGSFSSQTHSNTSSLISLQYYLIYHFLFKVQQGGSLCLYVCHFWQAACNDLYLALHTSCMSGKTFLFVAGSSAVFETILMVAVCSSACLCAMYV